MQRRLGCWLLAAVVLAGCAAPVRHQSTASDATDVWFVQHLVPHLRQTASIIDLTRDRITRPELAQLADTMRRQEHARLQLLQAWLDRRGLAAHTHSHQGIDSQRQSELERLARVPATRFDLGFLGVMAARHRVAGKLAATELREGSLPEVRQLARQLRVEQRRQARQMTAWRHAWSRRPPAEGGGAPPADQGLGADNRPSSTGTGDTDG